jgi:hypothetical protein
MGCFLAGIVYIVVGEDRQRIDAGEYRKVSDASSWAAGPYGLLFGTDNRQTVLDALADAEPDLDRLGEGKLDSRTLRDASIFFVSPRLGMSALPLPSARNAVRWTPVNLSVWMQRIAATIAGSFTIVPFSSLNGHWGLNRIASAARTSSGSEMPRAVSM